MKFFFLEIILLLFSLLSDSLQFQKQLMTKSETHLDFNPNLGGGRVIPPPCWFPLNNSEKVKPVTLAFHSLQQRYIRDIHAKFGISNSSQSSDIGQNSDGVFSDFWISSQSLIKEICHNSRTTGDIDMNHAPVTKLEKRKKTTPRKFNDDVMSANCDVHVIFPIYGQFGTIRKLDSGRII